MREEGNQPKGSFQINWSEILTSLSVDSSTRVFQILLRYMGVSVVSITEKVKECVPTEEAITDADPKYQFLLRNIVILAATSLRSQ